MGFIILFLIILIFLPKLCYSVGKLILGNTFEDIDTSSDSKITFHEHNYYTQNNSEQNIYIENKETLKGID